MRINVLVAALLEATSESSTAVTDATTTSNPLLDDNGQFVDPSQAVSNIESWWDKLDLFDKFIDKLPTVIIAVLLILLGLWLGKIVGKIVVKGMKLKNVDPSVYTFISRICSVIVRVAFILSAISMFFNINSVLAAFGAAGLTAGLGLQSNVAQFASGIQILLTRPFKTGDYVEVNGVSGSVAEIRFMNTVIVTVDNKRIIVPNSHITSNHIINYTAEDKRRVDLIFSISYSDDIEKSKDVLLSLAEKNECVLKEPAPQVFVNSHESSSVNLIVKVWCLSEHYWDVYYDMQEKVKVAFDENNISIPFNQLDVHIVDGK